MDDKLKREIITTGDGSKTIHIPDWNEQYHSKHGAINEAKHVFIKSGFDHYLEQHQPDKLFILEIGFGTGLNAFITYLEAQQRNQRIDYVGVEAYPVTVEEAKVMQYAKQLKEEGKEPVFERMHATSWETSQTIDAQFVLTKRKQLFKDITDKERYHLIYFDAFGARVQPELWTAAIFKIMYEALMVDGVLVTYAAKGSVRRAMQEVGFEVERLPGPPGKREMLRATKC